MNERLRFLRNELNLSRAAFGQRIGVSCDVVNNLERGRVDIKEHIIKLICSEFNLNEDWLRYGTEPVYIQPAAFSLDEFMKNRGISDFELEIVKAYFDLDPSIRKAVINHFKEKLTTVSAFDDDDIPDTPEELERLFPPS